MTEEPTLGQKAVSVLVFALLVGVMYLIGSYLLNSPSTPDPDALHVCRQIRQSAGESFFTAVQRCTEELG